MQIHLAQHRSLASLAAIPKSSSRTMLNYPPFTNQERAVFLSRSRLEKDNSLSSLRCIASRDAGREMAKWTRENGPPATVNTKRRQLGLPAAPSAPKLPALLTSPSSSTLEDEFGGSGAGKTPGSLRRTPTRPKYLARLEKSLPSMPASSKTELEHELVFAVHDHLELRFTDPGAAAI